MAVQVLEMEMNIEYDENSDKSSADLRIRKTQVNSLWTVQIW